MSRKELNATQVRQLCADVAEMEGLEVTKLKTGSTSRNLLKKCHHFLPSIKKSSTTHDCNNKQDTNPVSNGNTTTTIPTTKSNNNEHRMSKNDPLPSLVTMAILVGEDGKAVTALSEGGLVKDDDLQNVEGAFVCRIPQMNTDKSLTNNNVDKTCTKTHAGEDVKSLGDVLLNHLNVQEKDKLMKRMPAVLRGLKTNDYSTARSFIKSDRFADVRKAIKSELEVFVTKDLKMNLLK